MPDDVRPPPRKPRSSGPARRRADGDGIPDDEFDEVTYLRAFPDVLDAVDRGELGSGREHFLLAGKAEGRLGKPEYRRLRPQDEHDAAARTLRSVALPPPPVSADALVLSRSGAILLVGWADDRGNPLTGITVLSGGKPYSVWTRFPRLRRPDVGRAVDGAPDYPYGFWLFAAPNHRRLGEAGPPENECLIELHFANGAVAEARRQPQTVSDHDLRDNVMGRLAGMNQPESRTAPNLSGLDGRVGAALLEFNRTAFQPLTSGTVTEQFGPRRSRYRGSIIVQLDQVHRHLFPQSCVYAQGRGIEDYEFIYIVNQPELMEPILREARIAEQAYGLSQTLLLQPVEAGVGASNNAAARIAQSDRLLFIRPDVFPRDADWARQHTELLAQSREPQTRLFGTSLYYDNGSLRHGGFYFERDMLIDSSTEAVVRHPDLRVEAYGKGAPSWATRFIRSRPMPAVSGAFLSIDRGWFEKLGAFTEAYQFGQHEDIDLCLRSLREGIPAWLHPIRMWQLDLTTAAPPRLDEGGAILNRWLFNHRWASFIVPDLLGKAPLHPLLLEPATFNPPARAQPFLVEAFATTAQIDVPGR